MGGPYVYCLCFLFHFQLILLSLAQTQNPNMINSSNFAIFVFGDSIVDPGNNNYIRTMVKGNFPPYGIDFAYQIPTGRFTNGRLVTDFAASYAGIKDYVPPYLDPKLSMEELLTGVSFASSGSGFDPLTPTFFGAVISMPKQMDYFREYKSRVEAQIGKERTELLVKNAVYVISAGSNDFVFNYFGVSRIRRNSYSIPRYYQFLLQQIQQFIQDLMDLGAEKIVMLGLLPLGCTPIVITLNSDPSDNFLERQCIATISEAAQGFNQIVEQKIKEMERVDSKIYYVSPYETFSNIFQDPKKFGFDKVDKGCCATGLLELTYMCNPRSVLCPNVSEYVFFDSIHPTERTYYLWFQATLSPTMDLILQEK
ncbi:GDSL-motif lipase/hydrolase family protein [Heracleum sosnowskyi]|uniref:GDSL-motif lipase/hydrolase family protein n=1 Tax=Heracleum sosnowskyi TaxID=360622 RepID=A0AAD8HK78_9APIA|nr:GDSL-motif lipase/hydrolase family protein [Heracleum sosnowskyi]